MTKCKIMSTHSDLNAWSPQEVDSLENVSKEFQLLSTSPKSNPVENGLGKGTNINNVETKLVTGQSMKLHSSCDDLLIRSQEFECQDEPRINRSNTFINTKPKKPTAGKYDHVQSKIKQYFQNAKTEVTPPKPKPTVISQVKNISDKEDYLEQINKQLIKELDEKNAILALLQENYEHLLFKYAEAQNRIDELRIKVLSEGGEIKSSHKVENQEDYLKDYFNRTPDIKCQKAVVAPFMKSEVPADAPSISRPSSLPIDNNLKIVERDLIKAPTPTDSEGLSSVITSMSGHSKILNSLDEENQRNKKSNYLKYQTNKFDLEENIINDPFDKVKNWQNSLPPLEQIETPETALYHMFPNAEVYSSSETKYKDFSPRIEEKEFQLSDESCPDSWKEEQPVKKKFDLPTVSVRPSSLSTKCFSNASCRNSREDGSFKEDKITQTPKTDILAACTNQKRQKRPPLLRCSSLPAYDQISVKSGIFNNGIYVPPLDLNNVTLSDDESYCQQEYYLSKSNIVTSSFTASRSIQTPQSFSTYKATITEESSYQNVPKSTVNKSTSITPDRTRAMDLFFASRRRTSNTNCIRECNECCNDTKWCNVCGESISQSRNPELYPKSNSSESIHNGNTPRKDSSDRRQKPPFKRSVSFGSETITPRYCSHDTTQKNFFSKVSQDSLEDFDTYTSSLKARSDIVMKALTAHVNNCP